ncbi:hypothetical protein PMIN07_012629 [Paraphaeosphaeria minitans]
MNMHPSTQHNFRGVANPTYNIATFKKLTYRNLPSNPPSNPTPPSQSPLPSHPPTPHPPHTKKTPPFYPSLPQANDPDPDPDRSGTDPPCSPPPYTSLETSATAAYSTAVRPLSSSAPPDRSTTHTP